MSPPRMAHSRMANGGPQDDGEGEDPAERVFGNVLRPETGGTRRPPGRTAQDGLSVECSVGGLPFRLGAMRL